ncbi:hypothetical protein LEP1GSC202_3593 [Leptospira yanagawae serovar Saopaulo str. Sao Paulo = ATCC 700523]|uniref:Uncharacterized protein n=1 Tax=Leptospira yanagawae serovar Saopaulo str. Sao Paulo = ATCC 700523 TaxID=1249483 RepID=A0A5E8H7T5_9LEPT|nr:hypothetical protein LEP1GSC202_3593 [Leptospira yanagawae serovar Saopaulo str. Sao Paulo = ATCC 700523]
MSFETKLEFNLAEENSVIAYIILEEFPIDFTEFWNVFRDVISNDLVIEIFSMRSIKT